MALKQEKRSLVLATPLGEDVLVLTAFRGHEEMSRLFEFELEMISDDNSISAPDIVGKNVTFSVKLADNSPRHFNGFVSRFFAGDQKDERRNYRARVVPWLWFLTRTADCRIFQNKTVVEVIEQIFGDLGFSDFDTSQIKGEHPARDYCVQYRETDFDFVSRLMEEEGIFYFFKHEDGKHTLVLADQKNAYENCLEKEVDYPRDYGTRAIEDYITGWEHRYEFRTGKWAQTDYNFETPSTKLMTTEQTVVDLPGNDKYERYDYPGLYGTTGDGQPLTKIRMEEEEVEHDVVHAQSKCKSFTPGGKFKIKQHRSASEEGKTFVVTAIDHSATEPAAYETGGEAPEEDYSNSFTCVPDSVVFRPARTTPKPFVRGVQTAVVTGPSGEEIYTDKYGRIKVQFYWDREGKKDENSSCWIRVAQNWAGKNWGIVFNPRIGQEVIVDFVEGDPDRPIIVGRVYNAEQMPPYELPANQTQSTIKSRSSKGGGADNFNEIRFEDKKGSEEVYIHAEKDHKQITENDRTEDVGHDRSLKVGHDKTEEVGNDKTILVKSNESTTIDGNRTEKVKKNETITIEGNRSETVKKDEKIVIEGGRAATVAKDESLSVDGNRTASIDKDDSLTVNANLNCGVAKDFGTIVEKNYTLKVNESIVIESDKDILLKCGKASISLKKDGKISIKGSAINVKGSSDITIKGQKVGIN